MTNNTPSSLICFKNGYSYINIPVNLTSDQLMKDGSNIKECQVGPLPHFAVHGTVALAPHNPETVKIFSVSQAAKKIIKPLSLKLPTFKIGEETDYSYEKLLAENIGTAVRLNCIVELGNTKQIGTCTEQTFEGSIKAIHKDSKGQSLIVLSSLQRHGGEQWIKSSSVVSLETVSITDPCNSDSEDEEDDNGIENVRRLSVRYAVSKAHAKEEVAANLSYLTRGLTWAPSYVLKQDKKSKTMTLQGNACLLCDLPFFKGNAIDIVSLVAGQPKMECQNVSDPLASGVTAAEFIRELTGLSLGGGSRGRRRSVSRDRCFASKSMGFGGGEGFDSAEGVTAGENMDDLYFYKLKNVPLHYNRPMSLPFIEEGSPEPYKDVYFFDLSTNKRWGRETKTDTTMVEATHAITFKNTSEQPFTTAPVSVLMAEAKANDVDEMDTGTPRTRSKGNNFLVQGLMKYTGPNKTATVEITKAVDVEGKFVVETSKERKVEAKKKIKKDDYELLSVKITGTFTVTNMKNEEVKCKVDHELYGHLEKSVPNYVEVTEQQTAPHELNPTAKYVWEIQVPARGKAELVFNYCTKAWIDGKQEQVGRIY